jgi:ribonuclease-3
MGALLKDQGIIACKDWILNVFTKKLAELSLNNCAKDPKTQLQELMQSRKADLPHYELTETKGMGHKQLFSVVCITTLASESCIGTGVSRKRAEQASAEKMLALIAKQKR